MPEAESAAGGAELEAKPEGELCCEAPMIYVRFALHVKGKPPFQDSLFFTLDEYAKQERGAIEALARGRFAEREATIAKMLAEGVVAPEAPEAKEA